MPKLSRELIVSEYQNINKNPDIKGRFGAYMNDKYSLRNLDLAAEADDNMSLLRILKDHVQK
jgi:hypothetical protein|tara:strand:+ start:1528 stop:1713 length:186 start_codon:yes stop_codon:yes gene_type:complete